MKKQTISEEFKRMQVLAGLITESQLNEEQTNEIFGLGAKVEVPDKNDKSKMVKVGSGDLVLVNPKFDTSGYATDNEGVYIIDKVLKDNTVLMKQKAPNEYQTNQGMAARDISGMRVDSNKLAYYGKK